MSRQPELEEFRLQVQELLERPPLSEVRQEDELRLRDLDLKGIASLLKTAPGLYLLMAAARLNRTSLKEGAQTARALLVAPALRKAFAVLEHLPVRASARSTADQAVMLRSGDLKRKGQGTAEGLLRDRLIAEGIPLRMSPPIPIVPGILVANRRPDGVWPDPAEGLAPRLYLEIKNVQRVSDDIQKRLYEIAEVSLEMKALYGRLRLTGLNLARTDEVLAGASRLQARLRRQITAASPVVVAFLVCPREQAERYRPGAEALIDRVFFQEEVDECLDFLRATILRFQGRHD